MLPTFPPNIDGQSPTVRNSSAMFADDPSRSAKRPEGIRNETTKDEPKHVRVTLTVDEAAELLGIGRSTAYDAVNRGELPCVRVGRRLLILRAPLLRLLGEDGGRSHEEDSGLESGHRG